MMRVATLLFSAAFGTGALAESADDAIAAFAKHCFSPFLTAKTADAVLAVSGARIEFYDLRPFSVAAVSPVTGRAATPGTDRRCEVAMDGDHSAPAVAATLAALEREGISEEAALPDGRAATDGTALLAARYLNPQRIAVVHIGTRDGPNGLETFLNVERLYPQTGGGDQ